MFLLYHFCNALLDGMAAPSLLLNFTSSWRVVATTAGAMQLPSRIKEQSVNDIIQLQGVRWIKITVTHVKWIIL